MILAEERHLDKFTSLVRKHCPNFETLLKLISNAENKMNYSVVETVNIKYDFIRHTGIMSADSGIITSASDGDHLSFVLYMNEQLVFKEECYLHSPVTMEFMRASSEKWIHEVNDFLFVVLEHIFTAGVWQLSKVMVKSTPAGNTAMEEMEDIPTL